MLALATADASFVLPQYPVCRLREVFSDKIRLYGPLCRVPSEFTFTIASTDEDATRARFAQVPCRHNDRQLQKSAASRAHAQKPHVPACRFLACGTHNCRPQCADNNRLHQLSRLP